MVNTLTVRKEFEFIGFETLAKVFQKCSYEHADFRDCKS